MIKVYHHVPGKSIVFEKKILPNFRIFSSQIFVQFAEKIFYAICTKKFCPILGYFDLKFLYNLPIDKTRWV